jgi:Ca-activated chloride channel homolog
MPRLFQRQPVNWDKVLRHHRRGFCAVAFFCAAIQPAGASDKQMAIPWTSYQEGNWQKARDEYEAALKDPKAPVDELNYGLGASAYHLGDYEKAAQSFSESLTSSETGTKSRAHYGLGNTLYLHGESALKATVEKSNAQAADRLQEFLDAPTIEAAEIPGRQLAAEEALFKALPDVRKKWTESLEHYEAALSTGITDPGTGNRDYARLQQEKLQRLEQWRDEEKEKQKQEEEKKQEQEQQEKEEQEKEEQGKSGQQNQESPPGSQGKEEDKPEDSQPSPGEAPPKEPGEGKEPQQGEGEEEPKPGEENKDQQGNPEGDTPPSGEQPPPTGTPPEGEVKADQPSGTSDPAAAMPDENLPDPETGYSPEQARDMLEAFSDERKNLRFGRYPAREPLFKDW